MAYVYHNVNPKNRKVGDCSVRAVAAATGLSWDEAYRRLADKGFELKSEMSEAEVVEKVLFDCGFQKGTLKVSKGERRMTVAELASQMPDYYVVARVANHFVACAFGNYVDIWNSGDKAVYKYYFKKIVRK